MNKPSKNLELAIVTKAIENILIRQEILTVFSADDFKDSLSKLIYQAIYSLNDKKELIDANTIFLKIQSYNNYQISEEEFFKIISEQTYSNETIKQYISKLLDLIALEKIENAINEAKKELKKDKSVDDIYFSIESLIASTFKKRKLSNIEQLSHLIDPVVKNIKNLSSSDKHLVGIPSGFSKLDNLTNGFSRGDFILLAARPSMGKTAIALNFLVNAAEAISKNKNNSGCVVIFSIEMAKEQIIQRIISFKSAISLDKIRAGKLDESELDILEEHSSRIKRSNIWVNDNSSIRLSQIQTTLRELSLKRDIELVIIDYLQLIETTIKNDNKQQETAYISKTLKALARDINAPIIALSQLSRKVENREDKRPIMSDLRDSGALEQDADLILFLYREGYYSKTPMKKNDYQTADLIIAKHRNGSTGVVKLSFLPSFGYFTDE